MKNGCQNPKKAKSDKINERQAWGAWGEKMAAAYLKERGFDVVTHNWRCRLGEIDLIVARGHDLRFVEVKTRRGRLQAPPEASVTKCKLRHMELAMEMWLRQSGQNWPNYQADVIAITVKNDNQTEILWIEGV